MSTSPVVPGKFAHWKRNLVLAAVAGSLSLILFASFYSYDVYTGAVNTPSTPVTTDDLIAAYVNDPAQADSLFANKTYFVTGVPLSMQQDPTTGQYYTDLVFPGFIQFYWQDFSQASRVIPCADGSCQPILAKCFLEGFTIRTGENYIIKFDDCQFIH